MNMFPPSKIFTPANVPFFFLIDLININILESLIYFKHVIFD